MDLNSRPNSVDSSLTSPNTSNHFYHHHSSPIEGQQYNNNNNSSNGQQVYPINPINYYQNPNYYQNQEYLSQYYSQYYRDYYRQWMSQHNRQSSSLSSSQHLSSLQLKQPLKYGTRKCHSRAVFSQHNNHLLVVDNECHTSRSLRVYCLNDLFIDYLFPNQMFRNNNDLPFDSRDKCLQWIRSKQQLTTTTTTDFELKLILRIIQMILKQNSRITGLDLSELLFELIDLESLNKTLIYSENDLNLNYFRIYLMRGQKTVALNHALNPSNGLMAHALCLSYLMQITSGQQQTTSDDLMLKTIRKFCETLIPNDPISVYYNSVLNWIQRKQIFLELSFESFLILLSNEMNLNQIQIKTNSQHFKHLLDLIKCLQTTDDREDDDYSNIKDFVLSDELFESEMDSILINECLEFSLFNGKRFNKKLIEKKIKLISILFDFGFHSNCLKYCKQLKTFEDQLSSKEKRIIYEIESRFDTNVSIDQTNEEINEEIVEQTTPEDNNKQIDVNYSESIPQISENNDYYSQLSLQPAAPPILAPPVLAPPIVEPPVSNNIPNGDPMGFSFVSSSQSLPSMPFNSNDFFDSQMKSETIEETTNESSKSETKTVNTTGDKLKSSSGLLSKLFNFKPKNQAILPDDSNMTLKWDQTKNQWIDTDQQNNQTSAPPLRPPPMLAPSVGEGQKKFEFRSQRRYVDITRQE